MSNSNREVIDFLWDWANKKGEWAKCLLSEIVQHSSKLTYEKRSEIYEKFRTENENNEEKTLKPKCSFTGDKLILNSLSDIHGLNKLSSDSTIPFSQNLTVIYGENGTGKSGFSRILKNIGFSYDKNNSILPNVYNDENIETSAIIKYECNNEQKDYKWTISSENDELKNISVFNNDCVSIALGKKRNLIVTPLGFHLFELVKNELRELHQLIEEERKSIKTYYDWFENFHEGTEYYKIINNLQNTTIDFIDKKECFTVSDAVSLKKKEKEIKTLSIELLKREIKTLKNQLNELETIQNELLHQNKSLNENSLKNLKDLFEAGLSLSNKEEVSLKDLMNEKGIEVYAQQEFQTFIESAEKYISKMSNKEYPANETDTCIYCNQPLKDPDALDLIKKYRELLNSNSQKELQAIREKFQNQKSKIQQALKQHSIHQHTFGTNENEKPIQPTLLISFNEKIKHIIENINENNYSSSFHVNYTELENLLSSKTKELESILEGKNKKIIDIAGATKKLETDIKLLQDKKLFSDKKEDIISIIKNYKVLNILNEKASELNIRSLSQQTSNARQTLIEQKFEEKFLKELKALRKGNIKVDLNFGTSDSLTTLSQTIRHYKLTDILSEGEQKAISLSLFLAELDIVGGSSPVIFDDPVNSLDHHIIDEVTKRLLKLSKERQVVIFTHSILFFNSLLFQGNQPFFKDVQSIYLNTTNQYGVCGIITDAEVEINKDSKYIKRINKLLNNTPKERKEEDVSAEGYGYLRSAIELTVEH